MSVGLSLFKYGSDSPLSFVATLLHPLFFTSGAARQITVHEDPETGQRVINRSIVMTKYLNIPPARQLLFKGGSESPVSKPALAISNKSITRIVHVPSTFEPALHSILSSRPHHGCTRDQFRRKLLWSFTRTLVKEFYRVSQDTRL